MLTPILITTMPVGTVAGLTLMFLGAIMLVGALIENIASLSATAKRRRIERNETRNLIVMQEKLDRQGARPTAAGSRGAAAGCATSSVSRRPRLILLPGGRATARVLTRPTKEP